jgi:hypothetical protein
MTHHLRTVHGKSITEFQGRGGGPLEPQAPAPAPERVPTGETQRVIGAARKGYEIGRRAAQKDGRPVIYCPVCGTNIHNVQTAVNFGET